MFQHTVAVISLDEGISEIIYNRTQDNARSGFNNLGSGSNTFQSSPNGATSHFINGQAGDDRIFAFGTGNNVVHAGSGNDFIVGGSGDDRFWGGSGDDTLEGGSGLDQLFGGSGADQLWGGAGADLLQGGTGNDRLFGDHDGSPTSQQGRDTLDGGSGNDYLSGGGGADVLIGGSGADTFAFETHRDLSLGHSDVIRDFSRAEGDKIDLSLIDANLNAGGDQAFVFTNGPSNLAGRMWLGDVFDGQQTVFFNVDGGAIDVSLTVRFDDPAITGLQASDFFL
jgi:Ca2+-binding RTX toxin-like protein